LSTGERAIEKTTTLPRMNTDKRGSEKNRVNFLSARFAAFRPSKPRAGFRPNTRKPRVLGLRVCWEQLRASLRRKEMFFPRI